MFLSVVRLLRQVSNTSDELLGKTQNKGHDQAFALPTESRPPLADLLCLYYTQAAKGLEKQGVWLLLVGT